MTSPNITDTLTELNDLCRFFIEADETLKNNKITDMTGVDTRVSAVCQKVAASVPEQQKEFLPLLNTLIELLNNYEKALINLQKETQSC